MKDHSECSFHKELPSKGISTSNVFFVFDSKAHEEDKLMRKYLENWLSNYDLNLCAYDTNIGASKMAFCEHICRKIIESPFIIADVTDYSNNDKKYQINPNVMLEIGIAMGYQKDLLLITRKPLKKPLPFDIAGFSIFQIQNEPEKVQEAIDRLSKKNPSYPLFKIITGTGNSINGLFEKIESHSINRKYVQNYLTTMSRRDVVSKAIAKDFYKAKADIDEYINIAKKRKKLFYDDIKRGFNIQIVYQRNDVETRIRNFHTAYEFDVKPEEMLHQINEHLKLIEYDNFNIGLIDQPLPYLFSIFGDNIVLIENEIEGKFEGQIHIGGMIHTSNVSVDEFSFEFSRLWDNSETNKEVVIEWLERLKNFIIKK